MSVNLKSEMVVGINTLELEMCSSITNHAVSFLFPLFEITYFQSIFDGLEYPVHNTNSVLRQPSDIYCDAFELK